MDINPIADPAPARPVYRWPWFLLGAVILAILLAIIWMSYAVKKTRTIRDLTFPPTNAATR
jgi:hypothetical protein